MKRTISILVVLVLVLSCSLTVAFGSESGLDSLIGDNSQTQTQVTETPSTSGGTTNAGGKSFISDLSEAANMSKPTTEAQAVQPFITKIASVLFQVITYAVIAFLAVRVALDMAYIGLPFVRSFLCNGFSGNAQAGQPGMGMGGPGMGGPGMGMGGPGMGMGMGGGMGRGMGMGMGGMSGMGGMGGMGMQSANVNNNGTMMGRIQWVSNAALNAVASESQGTNAFKIYAKDMVVVFIAIPVLLTLAATGTLTNLGFLIGDVLMRAIQSLGDLF